MRLAIVDADQAAAAKFKFNLGKWGMPVNCMFHSAENTASGIEACDPEVIFFDIGLPGMNGVDLIREIKVKLPETEIIVFTAVEDRDIVLSAIRAGASGYVLKSSSPSEIVKSIEIVLDSGAPMSPRIAKMLIREFQEVGTRGRYLLSAREKKILFMKDKGLTYKEIAGSLSISFHTVHSHIKKIYEKLQVKNRKEALLMARKKGIL